MPYTTPAVLDKKCVSEKYLYQSIQDCENLKNSTLLTVFIEILTIFIS